MHVRLLNIPANGSELRTICDDRANRPSHTHSQQLIRVFNPNAANNTVAIKVLPSAAEAALQVSWRRCASLTVCVASTAKIRKWALRDNALAM